jgi:hypothetical protein
MIFEILFWKYNEKDELYLERRLTRDLITSAANILNKYKVDFAGIAVYYGGELVQSVGNCGEYLPDKPFIS